MSSDNAFSSSASESTVSVLIVLMLFACTVFLRSAIAARTSSELLLVAVPSDPDGSVVSEYPLSQNRTVVLNGSGGTNVLVIEDGTARIDKADCPDGLCCKTGKVSRSGQSIICLPHKLTVEITGEARKDASSDVDIMVK